MKKAFFIAAVFCLVICGCKHHHHECVGYYSMVDMVSNVYSYMLNKPIDSVNHNLVNTFHGEFLRESESYYPEYDKEYSYHVPYSDIDMSVCEIKSYIGYRLWAKNGIVKNVRAHTIDGRDINNSKESVLYWLSVFCDNGDGLPGHYKYVNDSTRIWWDSCNVFLRWNRTDDPIDHSDQYQGDQVGVTYTEVAGYKNVERMVRYIRDSIPADRDFWGQIDVSNAWYEGFFTFDVLLYGDLFGDNEPEWSVQFNVHVK